MKIKDWTDEQKMTKKKKTVSNKRRSVENGSYWNWMFVDDRSIQNIQNRYYR